MGEEFDQIWRIPGLVSCEAGKAGIEEITRVLTGQSIIECWIIFAFEKFDNCWVHFSGAC